ncbi:MAG: type II toxin-antitoxin system HicB family antitoxin [Spirulina sp.]
MDFYTVVSRQSAGYWVSLCLENSLVGQGRDRDESLAKLKEAIESFTEVCQEETNVYNQPISIQNLHEFLTVENQGLTSEIFELRAVHA